MSAAKATPSAISDERDAALKSWNGPSSKREWNTDVTAMWPFGLTTGIGAIPSDQPRV